jgi:hypothetical protein
VKTKPLRVLSLLFIVLLACVIPFCSWQAYQQHSLERADVIGTYIYDCPDAWQKYSNGVHTLMLKDNGTYYYYWKSDEGDAEAERSGVWSFTNYAGHSVWLEEFMFEGDPGPGRRYTEESRKPHRQGFPVARSVGGALQLLLGEHPDYQFNKQE